MFERRPEGVEVGAFYGVMRGVFDGEVTKSAKSISERTIDVFPDNLEVGGLVFQPVVCVAKAMQND